MSLFDESREAGVHVSPKFPTDTRVAEGPAQSPSGAMTLFEAYRLALAKNENVKIADARIETERLLRRQTKDLIKPIVDLNGSQRYQRDNISNSQGKETKLQTLAEAKVSQPLFRRGEFTLLEANDEGIEAARAALLREQQTLARDVAVAFISVIRTRKLAELALVDEQRAKDQLDAAIARAKSGNALKNAELQARVDVKRAEQRTASTKRDVVVAEATFFRLVGDGAPKQLAIPPEPPLPTSDKSFAQAQERPDLVELQHREEQARANADAASQKRWWPRADVVGQLDYYTPAAFGSPTSSHNLEWIVLGTLTIPVFEANQHTDALSRANDLHIAELEREYQLRVISEDVASAIAQVIGAQEASKLANEQLQAAKDLYSLVDKQFKLGAVTYIEITNAQNVLVEAENTYEVSNMDRISALYDYLYATGAIDLSNTK
ncbi:MAG TPA: TolC family protein [Kofleriaceae bacterium]|jgi:outer membrane protein TolC